MTRRVTEERHGFPGALRASPILKSPRSGTNIAVEKTTV